MKSEAEVILTLRNRCIEHTHRSKTAHSCVHARLRSTLFIGQPVPASVAVDRIYVFRSFVYIEVGVLCNLFSYKTYTLKVT